MTNSHSEARNGDRCVVEKGTHAGKTGVVQDCHTSKTGHVTVTIVQSDGARFKTLARNLATRPAGST